MGVAQRLKIHLRHQLLKSVIDWVGLLDCLFGAWNFFLVCVLHLVIIRYVAKADRSCGLPVIDSRQPIVVFWL